MRFLSVLLPSHWGRSEWVAAWPQLLAAGLNHDQSDYLWQRRFEVGLVALLCFNFCKKPEPFLKSGREVMTLEWLELEKSRQT